jgi:hypothetical protein
MRLHIRTPPRQHQTPPRIRRRSGSRLRELRIKSHQTAKLRFQHDLALRNMALFHLASKRARQSSQRMLLLLLRH